LRHRIGIYSPLQRERWQLALWPLKCWLLHFCYVKQSFSLLLSIRRETFQAAHVYRPKFESAAKLFRPTTSSSREAFSRLLQENLKAFMRRQRYLGLSDARNCAKVTTRIQKNASLPLRTCNAMYSRTNSPKKNPLASF
jgi:hypothetical protein